ncbi:MAG: DegT/DnrJ/EryC1/StrS family aminotransferase [Pontiellaceae bacterium]|nr:DegT/DnrJ/EryC1/StrS family aminotransferase [Pontiellaceae bacterium]MBN2784537.1 DegT/DnrJ/EryC1/StrS family aminotransferase [Pontiellaceae bacterium]
MQFEEVLHVGAPNIGGREEFHRLIDEMFDRRWLTNHGMLVQEFESRLADYLGVKHCITLCNGTTGLELAIRALDLSGEVIVPSFTFIATAHALKWQEITPVFCDIDRCSYTLDPDVVERRITAETTGILGVHLYGRPCEIDRLQSVADRYDLKLLFDAAHAFGCSHGGRMIGNFGRCEVFSFHATKVFNTFEGGAITTNDDQLAQRIRLMLNFGFAEYDKVVYLGTNGKMSEVCAAMGLVNLNELERFIAVNRMNYEQYRVGLESINGLELMPYQTSERCNWQYIVVEVRDAYSKSRDELIDVLHSTGILARRYFWPGCHRMEPYCSLQPDAGQFLPVTDHVAERLLVLPNGTATSSSAINRIIGVLRVAGG